MERQVTSHELTGLGLALDSPREVGLEAGTEIESVLVAGFHLEDRLVLRATPLPVQSPERKSQHTRRIHNID